MRRCCVTRSPSALATPSWTFWLLSTSCTPAYELPGRPLHPYQLLTALAQALRCCNSSLLPRHLVPQSLCATSRHWMALRSYPRMCAHRTASPPPHIAPSVNSFLPCLFDLFGLPDAFGSGVLGVSRAPLDGVADGPPIGAPVRWCARRCARLMRCVGDADLPQRNLPSWGAHAFTAAAYTSG